MFGGVDCDCNMDGVCVQKNQSGGVLFGLALCGVVVVRVVSEWDGVVFELKKSPLKQGVKFLVFLSLGRQC